VPLPIVLHHGLLGFDHFRIGPVRFSNFAGIDRAFVERGHPIIETQVHPSASIARRAMQLKGIILENLSAMGRADSRVIVFAHSMGGLDARYMIAKLGMEQRVAALVTISTPHWGSPYADWCAINLGKKLGGYRLLKNLGLDIEAVLDLTTDSCRRFNETTPDVAGVNYFSVSCARERRKVPPTFYHSHKIVALAEGENDGLVSVKSAQCGEHLGTWRCDHLHAINKRFIPEFKEKTGDIVPYYVKVLDRFVSRSI
jgi:triacylglycerol lipase